MTVQLQQVGVQYWFRVLLTALFCISSVWFGIHQSYGWLGVSLCLLVLSLQNSYLFSVALSAKHLDITEQFKVSIIHENCASSHSGCVHGFTTFSKYPLYRLILFGSPLIVNFQITVRSEIVSPVLRNTCVILGAP